MQILKLAFVSALVSVLVSAAPVQQRRDAVASDAQAQIARSFDYGTIPEKRLSIPFFAGRALKMIGWKEAEIDSFLTTDEGKDFVSKLALVEKRDAEVEGDEHEKRLVPWVVGARAGLGILNMAQRIIKSNKETINDNFYIRDLVAASEIQARNTNVHADIDLLGLLHPELNISL